MATSDSKKDGTLRSSARPKFTIGVKKEYPSKEDLMPFLSDHVRTHEGVSNADRNSQLMGDSENDSFSTRAPVNAELVTLAKEFRDQLPILLGAKIQETRTFFLEQIAPYLLGVHNGLQDVRDILRIAFEEEVQVDGHFRRIDQVAQLAIEMKIISHIASYMDLTPQAHSAFLLAATSQELKGMPDVQTLLSQMLQIPELQGGAKRSKVPLQQLRKAEGDRAHRGTPEPAPESRPKTGRRKR